MEEKSKNLFEYKYGCGGHTYLCIVESDKPKILLINHYLYKIPTEIKILNKKNASFINFVKSSVIDLHKFLYPKLCQPQSVWDIISVVFTTDFWERIQKGENRKLE